MEMNKKAEFLAAGSGPVGSDAWVIFTWGMTYSWDLPAGFQGARLSEELADKVSKDGDTLTLSPDTAVVVMKLPGFVDLVVIQPLTLLTLGQLGAQLQKKMGSPEAQENLSKLQALLEEAAIANGELAKAISMAAQLKAIFESLALSEMFEQVNWSEAAKELTALGKKHFGDDKQRDDDGSDFWHSQLNDIGLNLD